MTDNALAELRDKLNRQRRFDQLTTGNSIELAGMIRTISSIGVHANGMASLIFTDGGGWLGDGADLFYLAK